MSIVTADLLTYMMLDSQPFQRKVHESSRSGSSDSGSGSDNAMPPINRRLPSAAFKSEAEFAAASRYGMQYAAQLHIGSHHL